MSRILTYRSFGLQSDPFPFLREIPIQFKGVDSKNPLSFKVYNPGELIDGIPMHVHMPMAMAYWHTICNQLDDMFGQGTAVRPWDEGVTDMEKAEIRMRVAFYFMWMLGIEYWCFHDTDIVPYGKDINEFHENVDSIVPLIVEMQSLTGIKCGWVTQNLFSHPMYFQGAATGTDPLVWCHGLAQTAKMIDVGKIIGAKNHVFWGGREGYNDLLVTDMEQELGHLAEFLRQAVKYKEDIGYTAQFLIEPKPKEPSRHQYDTNVASVCAFLLSYDLFSEFRVNVEVNHAQLDGSTVGHELEVAGLYDSLGGIDANQGTYGNDWDTDEFLSDPVIATQIMMAVLEHGLGSGVINWDAKARRESCYPVDLFHAHITGTDTLATGLRTAALMRDEGNLTCAIEDRYRRYDSQLGSSINERTINVSSARTAAYANQPMSRSGHLERANGLITNALVRCCDGIGTEHREPSWR